MGLGNRLVVVIVALAVVLPTMTMGGAVAQTSETPVFAVTQGGMCYTVEPLGDGTTTVEEFYDYRNNETSTRGTFSSYGTRSSRRTR